MKTLHTVGILSAILLIGFGVAVSCAEPGDALYGAKLYFGGETLYVASVDDAVTDLEESLASVKAEVDAGTMDVETAQAAVAAKITSVSQSVIAAQASGLSDSALVSLQLSLARFAHTLQSYSDTLVQLDSEGGSGSSGTSVVAAAQDALSDVSDHLEEALTEDLMIDEVLTSETDTSTDGAEESEVGGEHVVEEVGTLPDEEIIGEEVVSEEDPVSVSEEMEVNVEAEATTTGE